MVTFDPASDDAFFFFFFPRVNAALTRDRMEGNRVSARALLSLADLTPSPLVKVV